MKHFKKTIVVFLGTALNFFFAYLLHFVLGRLLGPHDYGVFGVVTNIAWVTSIPLGAVGVAIVKYSSVFNTGKDKEVKIGSLLAFFLKFSLVLNLVFVLFYFVFSGFFSDILGGGLTWLIIIFAVSLPFSGVSGALLMFLQGLGKVYGYSFVNVLSVLIKFAAAFLLVLAGFGVFGALLSLTFASIGVILLCIPFLWSYFGKKKVFIPKKKIFVFGLSVLFTTVFVNLVIYFDLFFVKSFLGSEQAGYYEAAVTLCRAFLMTSSILAVFFPEFNKDATLSNAKSLKVNVNWALIYTTLICLIGLIAYWVFPELIVNLTYSSSYLETVPILKVLSFGYVFYSLFNVLLYALWALNKQKLVGYFGIFLFIIDMPLLYFLVPVYGVISAAWITTGLLGVLFIFSFILVYSQIIKKQIF